MWGVHFQKVEFGGHPNIQTALEDIVRELKHLKTKLGGTGASDATLFDLEV
jgi:hypothetical protein